MKQINIATSILLTIFFLQSIQAQFPTDRSYQSIAPPIVAAPNYLGTVVDNSVSDAIQMTRITNYYQPWNWYPVHEYSKTQVWNADQTLIRIRSWKIFDANTFQEVQTLTGDIYPSYWSNTNPDLIWSFKEDGDVKKYTVSTNTTQIVANIPGYDIIKLGPGEGNIDKFDHYVALVGKRGVDLDVIIFDLQTLQITHTETFAGVWGNGGDSFPQYIDWVSISQSGNYVVIMWNHNTTSENNPYNSHYGVEVFNTLDMQYQNRIISYGNHGDLGYAADGGEVLVQNYGLYGNGTLYMHKLDGSGSTVLSTHADFGVDEHISCRNINRPGWAYIVHNMAAQSGQMIAVKLDNSGLTEHFGHHFSSSTIYDKTPMLVPSPNGDEIFFRSDFGDSANADLSYCYVAKLANSSAVQDNLDLSISAYPNPASDFIMINSKHNITKITVYNVIGQTAKTFQVGNLKQAEINIANLEKGLYFFNIVTNKGTIVKKVKIE